jgi:L-threonylcarbamoyladenylate synthase
MNNKLINIISKVLKQEFVIAIPTDTIIGLVCMANSNLAIKKIYNLKKRDINKPLSLLVNDIVMAKQYVQINNLSEKLINDVQYSFTIIGKKTKKAANLSPYINQKNNNLAVRVPKDKLLLGLIKQLNMPLIATSANFAGEQINYDFTQIKKLFAKQVEYFEPKINKTLPRNNPSAIIDCVIANQFNIIRASLEQKKYIYEKFTD